MSLRETRSPHATETGTASPVGGHNDESVYRMGDNDSDVSQSSRWQRSSRRKAANRSSLSVTVSAFWKRLSSDRPGISAPYDPVHLTRVRFNYSTGEFIGLPKEWVLLLQELDRETTNPQAIMSMFQLQSQDFGRMKMASYGQVGAPQEGAHTGKGSYSHKPLPPTPSAQSLRSEDGFSSTVSESSGRATDISPSSEPLPSLHDRRTSAPHGASAPFPHHDLPLLAAALVALPHGDLHEEQLTHLELVEALQPFSVTARKTSSQKEAQGAFADVWKGELPDGRPVALKVLRWLSEGKSVIGGRIFREVNVWSKLQHRNILPFLGANVMRDGLSVPEIALVSPWKAYGCVTAYLRQYPEASRVNLLDGIADGLTYLHEQGIVHNDVKGANILVGWDGVACLADFGLSGVVEVMRDMQTNSTVFQGTMRWMAPERMRPVMFGLTNRNCRSPASDVYAFGMTILEVFTEAPPFRGIDEWTVVFGVLAGLRPPKPDGSAEERGLTNAIWSYIQSCWGPPSTRPSAAAWKAARLKT